MNLRILSSDAIWVLIYFVFTPSNATSMIFSQQISGGKLFLVCKKVMLVLDIWEPITTYHLGIFVDSITLLPPHLLFPLTVEREIKMMQNFLP